MNSGRNSPSERFCAVIITGSEPAMVQLTRSACRRVFRRDDRFMEKIKVLLSSRPKLLSEVIRNMIEHQPDMEVVGEVLDPIQLLITTRSMPVDVVIITPLKANGNPRICSQLLGEHPLLKILILSAESKVAFLYQSGSPKIRIDEPSKQSILSAIRESMK